MIDTLLERAHQLLQAGRFADAEKELRQVLAQDPNIPFALALFAICRAEQGFVDEALKASQSAISKQPDNDYFLYLQALFLLKKDNLKEAEKSIRNAIAFNPVSADYYGLLANIKINLKEWEEALKYANEGLQKDADNLLCLNSRSTALYKLDRKEDAYHAIQEALSQDPENDATHTNIGWSLLEQGDHKKALEHFREALRINASNNYAKAGMVEGLKARYWFYRMFLKYAFWISNMKSKGQWAVILGLYFGIKILGYIADNNPTLALFITPIIYLYIAFAISTWIIEPLSNLFLRLNVYGRYALTKDEIVSSNFVGVSLTIGALGGIVSIFSDNFMYFMIMIFGITMMIPLASMFKPKKETNRKILMSYTAALALVGVLAIFLFTETGTPGLLATIYVFGVLIYQWVANALMIR
jgi:tetratricopeptide (TPR) repeat protein